MDYLSVAIGGFLGSIARFLAGMSFLARRKSSIPLSIAAINIAGCFLLGLVLPFLEGSGQHFILFASAGFLGSFTTMSTFSLEAAQLLRENNLKGFVLYIILSLGGSLLAFSIGRMIGMYLSKIL
ncbi:fluoride efflux transporter CrcB [Peribacillus sp. SCS-37]|uniref:fluoride efflux transporter CrcB n=1 Tax=Paraperibacillus esterisolvens TaxID=3115296 RepID=UPI003906298D